MLESARFGSVLLQSYANSRPSLPMGGWMRAERLKNRLGANTPNALPGIR